MNDLLTLSGAAQARLIRERHVSSVELVQAHLDRIDQVNPKLNAAVQVFHESALREARLADERLARGESAGPFDGVPFSIKDSIEVAGTVCTAGTLGLAYALPSQRDATLVERLRAAGAIPIAKTNLPDLLFAFESDNLIYGRTSNPYDLSRTSGGSSGGESALIAAGASPFGLGSDAAGSVRVPAHFCGIASIKPTSGRLARTGHVPTAGGWLESVWQIGPMARHVEDLWALMPLLLGPDGFDPTVVDMPHGNPSAVRLGGLRVAFFTDNGFAPPTPETVATVQSAARALAREVASLEEKRPPGIERSYELEMRFLGPDGGDRLREFHKSLGNHTMHPLFEQWLAKLEPFRTTLAGFAQYWRELDHFRAGLFSFLADYDVILGPVCAQPAMSHSTSTQDRNFAGFGYTMAFNMTGWPAAVVRCGESAEGLPIGVQIAAGPWREDIVLAVARRLEELLGGWRAPAL